MKEWSEIVVPVAGDVADDVAAELVDRVEFAASGTQWRDGEIVFWVDAADAEAAVQKTRAVVAELEGFIDGCGLDPGAVRVQAAAPEAEWREAWKRHFRAARLTDRIAVVPSWDTFEARAGDIVLSLDPGQAFGTGLHATTRLCLEELDQLAARGAEGARVLDFGCGSGILAIAAAKLWPAAEVWAIDSDPIAVDATADNARRNRVGERVKAALVDHSTGVFPVIVANIQRNVLLELRDALVGKCAPGGWIVLAGLLSDQAAEVAAAYEAAGMQIDSVRRSVADTEWSVVRLRRPPS